nr:hypothetical protein [uncultured Blautia sp.]
MAEEVKVKKINEQEMAALCQDMWPHICAIREALEKHGVEDVISVSMAVDGYVSFSPSGSDWELLQISTDDGPELRCRITRKLME